jgi:hypothetical protein
MEKISAGMQKSTLGPSISSDQEEMRMISAGHPFLLIL